MSFSISISGHSGEPHNVEAQAAFDAAVAELNKIPGVTGTASGYSNDNTGSATFGASLGASELPAESGTE